MVKITHRLSRLKKSTGKLRARFNRALGFPISRKKRMKKFILIVTVILSVTSAVYWHKSIWAKIISYSLKLKAKLYQFRKISNSDTMKSESNTASSRSEKIARLVFIFAIPLVIAIVEYVIGSKTPRAIMPPPEPESIPDTDDSSTGPMGFPSNWPEWVKVIAYGLQICGIQIWAQIYVHPCWGDGWDTPECIAERLLSNTTNITSPGP